MRAFPNLLGLAHSVGKPDFRVICGEAFLRHDQAAAHASPARRGQRTGRSGLPKQNSVDIEKANDLIQ